MPRGRKPKPTPLKILTGNPGKRPLNGAEPKPAAKRPSCPKWLAAEAKAKWRALAPELHALGLLTIVDGDTLACYCQAWAELREASELLAKDGRIVRVGGQLLELPGKEPEWVGSQLQPHPAVAQQRSAWAAVRAFAALFGLDPSSRSRLQVPGGGEEADPFEELLKRARGG